MSRFTAWMASRRKSQRRQGNGATSRRAARSLSFERCEQRIVLSTNAGYEPTHLSFEGSDGSEGGFIVLTNGAGVTLSTWKAGIVHAFSSGDSVADQWSWTNAYESGYQSNSGASLNELPPLHLDLSHLQIRPHSWGGSFGTIVDADTRASNLIPAMTWQGTFDGVADYVLDAGLFITESNVVPIPPPSTGTHGDEGGQISMIPFIGPSMFGLPGANESHLAARTRQALGAEQLESTPAADSGQADSLRGRAVVYEVAHAHSLTTAPEEVVLKRTEFKSAADKAGSIEEFETADGRRDATSQRGAARLASFTFDVSGEVEYARQAAISADRAATEAMFVRASLEDQREAADGEAVEESAASRVASARDAAFDQLEQEADPLKEQREAAAAAADAHQRRILGGTLIAVAAIPVLKTIRRKGQQQAVEARPRRSFHAG